MHRFNPDNWHVLVSEERARLMPPASILDQLPLRPELIVADIGCGPGFFTLPLAERLTAGFVHGIDIEPAMLEALRERAARAGLTNIATHLAVPGAAPLVGPSLDAAFMAMTFLFIPAAERRDYLVGLRGLVRPTGWLAILDWERRQNPGGGPPLAARVTPEETLAALAAAGWQATLLPAPNEWMYLLLARPQRDGDPGERAGR